MVPLSDASGIQTSLCELLIGSSTSEAPFVNTDIFDRLLWKLLAPLGRSFESESVQL